MAFPLFPEFLMRPQGGLAHQDPASFPLLVKHFSLTFSNRYNMRLNFSPPPPCQAPPPQVPFLHSCPHVLFCNLPRPSVQSWVWNYPPELRELTSGHPSTMILCYRIFQYPVVQQGGHLTFTDTWFPLCRRHSLSPIHHFSADQRSRAHTMPRTVLLSVVAGPCLSLLTSSSPACCPSDSQSPLQWLLLACVDRMI